MKYTHEKEFFFHQLKDISTGSSIKQELLTYQLDDYEGFLKEWCSDFRKSVNTNSVEYRKKNRNDSFFYFR